MRPSTLAIGVGLMVQAAFAVPVITILSADAPNNPASLNYITWRNNAIQALLTGVTSFGTTNTPSFFTQQSSFTAGEMIVTDFPSWKGVANPPSPYNGEFGNRITFATLIRDSLGAKINIAAGLNIQVPPFGTNPGFSGTGTQYTNNTIGINFVGAPGGFDDTLVTSGSGLVDAIVSFPGFGYQALASDTDSMGNPFPSLQANLNDLIASIRADASNQKITDCTSFGGVQTCASAPVRDVVPEPATITMLGSGLLALALNLRKRKA